MHLLALLRTDDPHRPAPTRRADSSSPFSLPGPLAPTRIPLVARSPGMPPDSRDRHLTRENVPLADVLAGYPTISLIRSGRADRGNVAGAGAGTGFAVILDSVRVGPGAPRELPQGRAGGEGGRANTTGPARRIRARRR